MEVVLSLGGSIIVPEKIDIAFLKKFRKIILDFVNKGNKVVIVAGGGHTCRVYQKAAAEINSKATQENLDWIGIKTTKLNAELIRAIFSKHAYEEVMDDPDEKIKTDKPIVVGSGWKPGCSSDWDTVRLAVNLGIDTVVNLSNIEYVYDKDPNKHKDAKKIEEMTWKQMQEIVGIKWTPGANLPFDPVAAKEAAKEGLKVVIMNGTDLENLKNFLEGKKYKGTTIYS